VNPVSQLDDKVELDPEPITLQERQLFMCQKIQIAMQNLNRIKQKAVTQECLEIKSKQLCLLLTHITVMIYFFSFSCSAIALVQIHSSVTLL